jgi:hypothetical protein
MLSTKSCKKSGNQPVVQCDVRLTRFIVRRNVTRLVAQVRWPPAEAPES